MGLVAKEEIREQVARYCFANDEHDVEAYCSFFEPDGVLAYFPHGGTEPIEMAGRDAIGEAMKQQWATARGQSRHIPSALLFDAMDGVSARSRCLFTVTLALDGKVRIFATGVYIDRWHHTADGGWLLARREVHLDNKVS